jgi:hypothetical protein
MFQKLDLATGNLDSKYWDFTSRNQQGWRENGETLGDGVTFKPGEGVYINNGQGETVKFRFSGEVELTPISMAIPAGFSMVGNMTPVAVDIKSIKLLNSAGKEMDDDNSVVPTQRSRGKVMMQKLDATTGNLVSTYYDYQSRNSTGWRKDGGDALAVGAEMLQPGEALYINNNQEDTVYFQFPTVVK